MADHVFPEDPGTGANEGDFVDAANLASQAYHELLADYVISGIDVTTDGSTIDVTAGMCAISDTSASLAQASETRDEGVLYNVIIDVRSGISLSDTTGVNYVFLDVDLTTDDTVSVSINTTNSAPANPSLKIAEVDASVPEVTLFNRDVELDGNIRAGDALINGKTLESTDTLIIGSDESMVVSGSYTVDGELEIKDGGSLTVI